jgi:hypothetical protein
LILIKTIKKMSKKKKKNYNNKSVKQIIVFSIILILLLSVFFIYRYKSNSNSVIESNNFIERFELKKMTSYDSVIFTGEYEDKIIKIKKYDDFDLEKSEQYISDKMFVINSLYREIHSPYPGELSNRIGCPEEYKPIKKENQPFNYYIIYASERLSYGACSDDLIRYKAINYFLYCEKENNFYHIELFIPKEENVSHYETLVKSIKCIK